MTLLNPTSPKGDPGDMMLLVLDHAFLNPTSPKGDPGDLMLCVYMS